MTATRGHVRVVGCGRVGIRAAEVLRDEGVAVSVADRNGGIAARTAFRLALPPSSSEAGAGAVDGRPVPATGALLDGLEPGDVALLCVAAGDHAALARVALSLGVAVVSVGDSGEDVKGLLDLHIEGIEREIPLVAGAGFTPGLSCLLALHAANLLDAVDEVHVAKAGTGGPACARQHHAALRGMTLDWRDGGWVRRRSGSGRQLAYFAEPVGPRDCYRADAADTVLLQRAFPRARRVTARMAATRRDRLTANLPMLRPPHPEGGPGALRVEVWGRRGGQREVVVYGAVGPPGRAAGSVAALAALGVLRGEWQPGLHGLAEVPDPVPWLARLEALDVRVASFEGVV